METELQTCRILQLSDCTMMYILSYLDATSLFNLSRTCSYFKNIVEDPRLWRYIDARQEPNNTKKVEYVCDRIYDNTSHLFLRAESKHNGLVPTGVLLEWNLLQHLTVLALENQRFDGRVLTLLDFPKTLKELSLKKTYVKNGKLFFQSSFNTMVNLRVLILDECDWLDSNFFMSVAKYENLEILSIVKCMRLHLNVIPYLNVARHGCKKLKIIDCRFNTVGNEILVHSHKSLLALYFQSMSSYQLDTGRPLLKVPPMTTESQDLISQSTIKNRSLDQYKYIIGDIVEELPHSILYQDPYPECSCGWKDRTNNDPSDAMNEDNNHTIEDRSMPIDDYIDFNLSPQRFICRRHVRELNRLPKDFKNFFYENQKKFYPDSSDNDSDSDDDRDCCMFGVGKSQQMIVLKLRETDAQGNLPEPEVIDIFQPCGNVINIDIDLEAGRVEQRHRRFEPDPQPSTSRAHDSPEGGKNNAKRKSAEEPGGSAHKKARIENEEVFLHDTSSSSESEPRVQGNQNSESSSSSGSESTSNNNLSENSRTSPAIDRPSPYQQRKNRGLIDAGPSGERRPSDALPGERFNRVVQRIDVSRFRELLGDRVSIKEHKEKIKLRRLSLRGYREITDRGLTFIRNLNLDLLDVTYTGVTKQGIEQFLTLNPNCRVIHPNYCVCKPRIPC